MCFFGKLEPVIIYKKTLKNPFLKIDNDNTMVYEIILVSLMLFNSDDS